MTLPETLAGLNMLNSRRGFLSVYVTQDEIAALAHAVERYEKLVREQAEDAERPKNGQRVGKDGAL